MRTPKIKKFFFRGIVIISLIPVIYMLVLQFGFFIPRLNVEVVKSALPYDGFSLETGDMLVRPNWNWLPGSSRVASGANFGHLAIVVQGAKGKSVEETLRKAVVIEALLFDQVTRRFIFGSSEIIRKTTAFTSFGKRFNGRRYLLRMHLTERQQQLLTQFVTKQLDDDNYTIFSLKKNIDFPPGTPEAYRSADRNQWNCATLAWFAFQYSTGTDIDSNKGLLIYPNDIIRSDLFDYPGRRILF